MESKNHNVTTPSVLFIIPDQFGYSAGYYYYCKYLLKAGYRVGVLSTDTGHNKIELEGYFEPYYVKYLNAIQYRIEWLKTASKLSRSFDIIILKQVFGLSIGAPFFDRKKTILDIRTGSVREGALIKKLENIELKLLIKVFPRIFILSRELAAEFKIPVDKYVWLPLGADEIAHKEKNYMDSLNLLYVGTFNSRNIHQAVEGFALFNAKYGDIINLSFDIVGNGSIDATSKIVQVIEKYHIQNKVVLHGYMTHQEAILLFEKCNIGVSYVPMKPCYDNQPPTKTYEYIISGLVCLGTATSSNKQIINEKNGILHDDNAEDFSKALERYYELRSIYHTDGVKATLVDYKWENIVNRIVIPSLSK